MNGRRVKILRKEAYPVYMESLKRHRFKQVLSFKSVFRQIKKLYKAGLPIYTKPARLAWPTKS